MARAGNFAVPAISPREGGQWRMLADSDGYSDMTTDLDFWSNSLFSGGVRISPLRNWGSRGPGFKSRQPDHLGVTPFSGPSMLRLLMRRCLVVDFCRTQGYRPDEVIEIIEGLS